ncbi:MAG: cupin domain-containing protein [Leptolyngbya sp. SIO1D8]|nr:cupin domain-containing protein [Leptolyngbya sp. SIO1D8]
MKVTNIEKIPYKEMRPGASVKFVHSDKMTFAFWEFQENTELPEHSHPHEQVVNILEGKLQLTVDGDVHNLVAGDMLVIPPDVLHGAYAAEYCRALDTFCPVREDYLDN